ncbi:major facilitator superfamily domain-containing protein 8-like [Mercenaria mercenaria]|uniref:major facilitator superfamily domain-containing protein 8-like n=1 Tax=Mercenaria mercenaria TaxID=6596 RepID=UPI00234F430B|nr:major facilitator superfamily domain-containing protein 8-like [Mercenaria mercenaria]
MGSKRTGNSYYYDDDDDDEESKLLRTIPPGISARTHSISGTQSVILEPPEVNKSRWRSIRVMYLTMFLSSVSFSICMSSLYPYLEILDPKASTNFLGWVVAAYSVGQLAASPFFGAWSNFRSKTREPIIVSLIINVLANVLYMYLESIHKNAKIYLMLARVFVGFGAGNVAVVRSYVSGATTMSERTSAMANMSACQAIGFIIGPLIQTALVPIGFPGPVRSEYFHFDMYTATGFFSALLGTVNIVLLLLVFKEHTVSDDQFSPINIQSAVNENSEEASTMSPDYFAVIPSIVLFFSVLFIFAVFETIATPMSMHMFAWKKSEATLFIGLMLGVSGFISIFVFAVIKKLSTRVNERYLLLFGFIMCLVGFVTYLPWGHQYPEIQYAEMEIAETTINNTVINNTLHENNLQDATTNNNHLDLYLPYDKPFSKSSDEQISTFVKNNSPVVAKYFNPNNNVFDLNNNHDKSAGETMDTTKLTYQQAVNKFLFDEITMKPEKTSNHSSPEAVGCPYYYDWCMYTPVIFLWQFFLGTFFVAVGYPTCNVMSYSIYSKILGPKPQGIWMGWLTAAGSLARTLGPVFVSQVYDAYGPRVTFVSLIGIIILTIAGFGIFFKRLVPFKTARQPVIIVEEPPN